MRNVNYFALLLFLFISTFINSQTPVGNIIDVNGIPLNGYLDALTYSPEKKIDVTHDSDSYEIGHYYNASGNKIEGYIKFENDKVWYRKEKKGKKTKLFPEEIKQLVIGTDSFFVIDKFYFKNRIKEKPEFVQYITTINNITFAKHYHFASKMNSYAEPITETFLIKTPGNEIWENFPNNLKFKEKALKHFSYIPYVKRKIENKEYESKDMLSVIKMADYLNRYNNKSKIYFDKYWQEVSFKSKSKYYAKIIDKQDSIWTMEYYNGSTKLYTANYSSFYPNKKNGNFTCYYPNGKVRQITFYNNDEAQEVQTFTQEGKLLTHYLCSKEEKTRLTYNVSEPNNTPIIFNNTLPYMYKNDGGYKSQKASKLDIRYTYIKGNEDNNLILKEGGYAETDVYDSITEINYFFRFNDVRLKEMYRLHNTDTIFQIALANNKFPIKRLQNRFNNFISGKDYDNALAESAQGKVLVAFLIDYRGKINNYRVLNKLHPEIDVLVEKFCKEMLHPTNITTFKSYKKGKTKFFSEVIIPIDFNINRFYRRPVNYYHNHWMHQQWHMQQMPKFNIPTSSFSGF